MSGIVVVFNLDGAPVDPGLLGRMAEAAAYRGPDGIRYRVDVNVGLAHLALNSTPESLQELQPLLSVDGMLCLTADARVDNRDELCSTLTTSGYLPDKDATDADLILAAYRCWGEACPEHMIGDFAFAVWDGREQKLFCARDPFGIKPLHYSRVGSVLCVASEAQQILQHPGVPRRLDEVAMADHLVNNCDDEERTMFLDVRRVPPGHRLIASRSGLRMERYWDIDPRVDIRYGRDSEYEAHFLALFQRAVADRLRSSGPVVGVAMSGGMDSTSIAAVAQRVLAAGDGGSRLIAYSYTFDTLAECDERVYSRAVAAEAGIEIAYIDAERFWQLDDPVAYEPRLETPFMSQESLTPHMLSRLRGQGGRAILTGHGGDTLLTGTPLVCTDRLLRGDLSGFRELAEHARYRQVPYPSLLYAYALRPLLPAAADRLLRRLTGRREVDAMAPEWLAPDFVRRTGLLDRLRAAPPARRFRSRARQVYYRHAMALGAVGRAVYWYDRSAARCGLEARHPFLDRRLAEFLLAIPGEQRYRGGRSKWLLRRAMDGILPGPVLERRDKTRFGSYQALGLREREAQQVTALLEAPALAQLGIVDAGRLQQAYRDYRAEGGDAAAGMLWFPITLELWLRRHIVAYHLPA